MLNNNFGKSASMLCNLHVLNAAMLDVFKIFKSVNTFIQLLKGGILCMYMY